MAGTVNLALLRVKDTSWNLDMPNFCLDDWVSSGVGDVAEDLAETGAGLAIDRFDDATLEAALKRLIEIANRPGIAGECRAAAEARFSLSAGVAEYDRVYRSLVGGGRRDDAAN